MDLKKPFLALLMVSCALLSCKRDEHFPESGSLFFPVGIGDSWILDDGEGRGSRYTVWGVERFDGKTFWVIGDSSYRAGESPRRYFHVDLKGNIQIRVSLFDSLSGTSDGLYARVPSVDSTQPFELKRIRGPDDGISTWYKLDAQPGEQWESFEYFPTFGLRVCEIKLLSRSDTVWMGGKLIQGCLKFEFDIVGVSDEEWYEWLAPGIGLVKVQNAFWREIQLHRRMN